MENIKVSVVVPVYNSEKYLKTCLESLLHQTLQEIEVICIDDGSTDHSRQILDKYAKYDKRLRVLHQKNQYAGVARNNGLSIAIGEYVSFFDSDDFFDLSLLEKAYSRAKYTNADIVIFGAQKYNTEFKTYEQTNLYFDRKFLPRKKVFAYKDVPDHIMMITSPAPWTKLYRREFIQQQKLQFQALQNSNDAYFTLLSMCVAERISYVNENLVNYRIGQKNNLQSRKSEYPTCFIDAYTALYQELRHRGIFSEVEKSYVDVVLSGCSYNLDTTTDPQARLKICEAISRKSFLESGVLNHPESYYADKEQYNKVKNCLNIWYPYEQAWTSYVRQRSYSQTINDNGDNPYVSVIIPVYNTEAYIAECLKSVCNQTLKNIEIIIVNDGTPDNSIKKVNEIIKKDSRIKVLNKENGGLSSARNAGMKIAAGEYILFLDSDDMLFESALELLYFCAKKENLDDLFFSALSFWDADCDGACYEKYRNYYKRNGNYSGIRKGTDLFASFVNNGDFKPSACLQLLKKSFLDESNITFREGIIHEDNLFTMECLLKAGKTDFLDLELYFRRIHDNSIMTQQKGMKNIYGYYICIIEILKMVDQYSDTLNDTYIAALEKQLKIIISESVEIIKSVPQEEIDEFIEILSPSYRILFDCLIRKNVSNSTSLVMRLRKKIHKIIEWCTARQCFSE